MQKQNRKYEAAISDCEFALLLTRKDYMNNESIHDVCDHVTENVRKAIVQKGNALMGLGDLEKAEQCYELLREWGKGTTADGYLKKVRDAKMRLQNGNQSIIINKRNIMSPNANERICSKLQVENTTQSDRPDQNENERTKKTKSKAKSKKKKSKRKSK